MEPPNWLEQFKSNLKCGVYSSSPNAQLETLNGLLALQIEQLLTTEPTALDGDVNQPTISSVYEAIKCGNFLRSDVEVYLYMAKIALIVTALGGFAMVDTLADGYAPLDSPVFTTKATSPLFFVGVNQVVGPRGAAVADVVLDANYNGADTINKSGITADIVEIKNELNALLARVRAHGLIAP